MENLQGGNSRGQTRPTRQSNFELLRIIAMFMIIMHHFFFFNRFSLASQPISNKRVFIQTFLATEGRVGVDLFFALSTWFLCKPNCEIKLHDSAKRAWLLERTLLFWSITLGIIALATRLSPVNSSIIMEMFLPSLSYHWWYATIYIVVLLMLPLMVKGLQALSQRQYFSLICLILFLGPVLGEIPGLCNSMINDDLAEMLCLLVLVCYLRWYHAQLPSMPWALFFIVFGYLIIGIQQISPSSINPQSPWLFIYPKMLNLGILVQAFGWFAFFSHLHFHSRFINWVASHVFAIYLITEFVPIRDWLWGTMFNYEPYYHSRLMSIVYPIAVVLLIFIICILLDIVKSVIFRFTVDRHKGGWFEFAWNQTVLYFNSQSDSFLNMKVHADR
jgi:surface polysaccharide O-acyltransferase-like enzyme